MGTSSVTSAILIRTSLIPRYTCTYKLLIVVSAYWHIGKDQKYDCRCPPVQSTEEKRFQEYQNQAKRQRTGTPPPPPRSPSQWNHPLLLQKFKHNKNHLLLSYKKNPKQKISSQKDPSQKKHRLMYTSRPPIQQA